MPLLNPFKPAPSQEQLMVEFGKRTQDPDADPPHQLTSNTAPKGFSLPTLHPLCTHCKKASPVSLIDLELQLDALYGAISQEAFKIILLTDCSNAHAAITQLQPRAVDRSLRILLCYVRDHMSRMSMSFVDATFNIADAGTKARGNEHLWRRLTTSNDFTIGFMGRKMARDYALQAGLNPNS